MGKIVCSALLAVSIALVASCGGSVPKSVYVSGAYQSTGAIVMKAAYWKDGVMTTLTASKNAIAYAVFVKDADVYVAGMCEGDTENFACYWKNGDVTMLSASGITSSVARSIFIDDSNNVYVAGSCNNGTNEVACYWTNGTAVKLTDGTQDAVAFSLFVYEGNVYVAGVNYNNEGGYWINDATHFTGLEDSNGAYSVKVKDGVVYVSGGADTGLSETQAAYWRDGVQVLLTDGSTNAVAPSLSISESSSVYIAGLEGATWDEPVYWKDTKASKTGLSLDPYFLGNMNAFASAVDGEILYVAATFTETNGGTDYVPGYWKDGSLYILSAGTGVKAMATDITVK